jgi:tRNA pseudouridine38-40 synthase
MPRYRLNIAYDGTHFFGWQKQHPPDREPLRTAQGVLEETIRGVMREEIRLLGASRTDSGVHARGQVAAFSSERKLEPERLLPALNSRLPDDLLVTRVRIVSEAFNPISDAVAKGYRYRIAHGATAGGRRPLFDRHFTSFCAELLDPERMHEAAQHLVGWHDFASFTRKHHGRESTIRTVHSCSVTATSRHRLRINVTGDGFLYNMVRIIAGTLMDVGRARLEPDDIPEILAACDRTAAGPTLPPEGLCLMWIRYPDDDPPQPA